MPIEQEFKVATDLSQIVEGVGTPGTQAGGVVTVQGDLSKRISVIHILLILQT
jgi:hypothetical protein